MLGKRTARRGFTLLEGAIATIVVIIVSFTAVAIYSEARITEIHEWNEQNALFLAEREVEAWHASGYNGLAGWTTGDVAHVSTPNSNVFLPYGYSPASPDGAWNAAGKYKPVSLDGFNYRIRAQQFYNTATPVSTPTDFYVLENWNNGAGVVPCRFRQIRVVVQWGSFSGFGSTRRMIQETRIAR